jgi:7-carboxy-7-deazaguanine synthase
MDSEAKLRIIEVFDSIQGEGMMMGKACHFIRLAGCNLSCAWCDTKYSWSIDVDSRTKEVFVKDLVNGSSSVKYVVITGGEPCIQGSVLNVLVNELRMANKFVCLETNGTLPTPININQCTVSPKPSSGYLIHKKCRVDELKFVVSGEDFWRKPVLALAKKYPGVPVWLQPNGFDLEESAKLAYDFVKEHPEYPNLRLGVQLHKIFDFQ